MLKDLDKEDIRELMYISMVVLISGDKAIGECKHRDSTIPEVVQILEPDVLLELMQNFPGQWIRIPSIEDMSKAARVVYFYYYTEVKSMKSLEAIKLVGGNKEDIGTFTAQTMRLKKFFKENSFKIPDTFCKSELMKVIDMELCEEK